MLVIEGSAKGSPQTHVTSFTDYITRPMESPYSIIRMHSLQMTSQCKVTLISDALFEGDETFKVKLGGHPVGNISEVEVTIKSDATDGKLNLPDRF